ncbi:hypothetical protein SNL152K_6023 [Streptomyces sp. NL15-2K]|nr:hypothetical protein SNL152K_6023 [Streptomyces sp. NL15-2K]
MGRVSVVAHGRHSAEQVGCPFERAGGLRGALGEAPPRKFVKFFTRKTAR